MDLYRSIDASGGWPVLPPGPNLALGDGGSRVGVLRLRLIATGDLSKAARDGPFDRVLERAVERFQRRHGLTEDGVVGRHTLAALNVPPFQRLQTLLINVARLRRERRDWGSRYIAVNIAAATYRLVIDGRTVFQKPAVVGRPSWPTPTLDSAIERVDFNPYWHIPPEIADQEVWPKQETDPGYFARQGIHEVSDGLVQDPGPRNPLGAVKFVFDNPFSVYLHDTSAPALFARDYRFLSHGCIRVSDAGDLARRLLAMDPGWPAARVDAALRSGIPRSVRLPQPIPLHIVYDTAWVADDGAIEFRDDVYHRDQATPVSGADSGVARSVEATTGARYRGSECRV